MTNEKTYTLLIWEEVPESTKLVLVPNEVLDGEDRLTLNNAHGAYINAVGTTDIQDDALNCISNALCDHTDYIAEEHPVGSKWAMRFVSYIANGDTPLVDTHITNVVRCGLLM